MANQIEGVVVSISDTGGLITDITESQLAAVPRDESVSVDFAGHKTIGIFPEQHNEPDATLMAILSDVLRIELVGISVSEMLGINVGESVTVNW